MPSTAEHNGSFAEQDAVSLLLELAGSGFSGSVRAEQDGIVKVLYLSEGLLACASSTDPQDRLGPLLESAGQITRQQLDLAEDKAVAGEALGSVLVNLGFIGPAGLMWGARRQVEQVLTSLMEWHRGTFRCRPGSLPERAVNLKLPAPAVVVAAARLLTRRGDVTSRLGSLDLTFALSGDASPAEFEDPDVTTIAALLDGRRDLRSVCAESPLDDFETAKVVLGLRLLGWVEPVSAGEPAPLSFDDEFADESIAPDDISTASLVVPPAPPFRSAEPSAFDDALDDTASTRSSYLDEPADDAEAARSTGAAQEIEPSEVDELGTLAAPSEEDPMEEDLPFDENEDRFVDDEGEPLPPSPGGSSRTWWIGGALVVVAMIVIFMMVGGDRPGSALDATGGPSAPLPGGAPATQGGDDAPPAEAEAGRDPVTPADAGTGAPSPAAPLTRADSPAKSPDPAPPATPAQAQPGTVETPAAGRTLSVQGGQGAFLDAYEAGDYARAARLGAQRVAAAGSGAHTLQVLVACQSATLDRMRQQVPASDKLLLVATTINGEMCYRVGWGTYPSRSAAEAARSDVPAYFRSGGERPIPVPLARLAG